MSANFYRSHADSWDGSRQQAHDSWQRIFAHVAPPPISILDLGCGNARLAGFLQKHVPTINRYVGVDTEPAFLELARTRYPEADFKLAAVEHFLTTTQEKFDLIVAFGLFHHLPGEDFRSYVLNAIKSVLSDSGTAVISFWQPKDLKNFDIKTKNDAIEGLEENDFLLGWSGDFSTLRYCHHFEKSEIDRLIEQSPFEVISQFKGTGNDLTNYYLIVR